MHEPDNDTKLAALRSRYDADRQDRSAAIDLAQFYADLGWDNEALELYREILQQEPDHFAVLLDYGNLCVKREDFEEALRVFMHLTTLRPDRIEGWNNLGIVYLSQRDEQRAREAFERILALEPENAGALLNIGNCHFERKEYALAAQVFEKVVAVAPDFADGWFNLGNARRESGDHDGAIKAYERSLRYRPDFPSALKNIGYTFELKGDDSAAEKYYRQALGAGRADASLYRNLALLCTRQGRTDEAREFFLQAVKLAPREMSGWMGLRHLSLVKGDINSYVKATLAVISRLEPDEIAVACATLAQLHHTEEILKILSQADSIDKRSSDLDAQRLLAYFRTQGRTGTVVALEKRLLGLAAPSDMVLEALAQFAFETGQPLRAAELALRVGAPSVQNLQLQWQIALVQQDRSRTITALDTYLKNNPESGDVWLMLGALLAAQNESESAKKALLKALELGITDMDPLEKEPSLKKLYEQICAADQSKTTPSGTPTQDL